jgi:hypothetical protein
VAQPKALIVAVRDLGKDIIFTHNSFNVIVSIASTVANEQLGYGEQAKYAGTQNNLLSLNPNFSDRL